MRYYLEGREIELEPSGVEVIAGVDRAYVRTGEGLFSGVAVRVGDRIEVSYRGKTYSLRTTKPRASSAAGSGNEARAPMPGLLVEVLVKPGDSVSLGQRVAVVESMKTHQPVLAPRAGVVKMASDQTGSQVQQGEVLVQLEPEEAS